MPKNISKESQLKIVEMYQDGVLVKKIANEFGIDATTVFKYINEYDIAKRGVGNKIRTVVSEEAEKEIIKMYQDGEIIKDIAKKFSMSPSGVNYYIAKNGMNKRKKCISYLKELPEEDIQNIIKMHQEGVLAKDICNQYSFDKSTLRKILDTYNIPRLHKNSTHKNFSEEDIQNIIKMYLDGARIRDIAKKFSITTSTVTRYINKYDIPKRKHRLNKNELKGGTDMARKSKLTEEQIQELIEIYKNNDIGIKYICDKFSIDKKTLYRLIDKYNIPTRIKITILTEEIEREIVELYKQGEPIKDIFDKFSIDKKILYRLIDKYNIPKRGAGNKTRTLISEETEKEIIKMYQNGEPVKDIAKKFSASLGAINYYIAKNEIDKRKKCMSYLKELPKEVKDKIYFIYYCLDFTIPNTVKWFKSIDPCFNHSTLNKLMHEWGVDKKCKSYNSVQREALELRKQIYTDYISSGLTVQEYCTKEDTLIIEPALEMIINQFSNSNNKDQVDSIIDTPAEEVQNPVVEDQQQINEVEEVVVEDTTDNNSDEVIEVVDTSSKNNNEIKKITNTCTHVYCTFFQDRHYFPDFVKSTIYEKRGLDSYTMFNMDYLYKKSKEFIESNVTFNADGNATADIICYMSGLQTVTGALMKACLDLKVNLTFMHYNKESDEWYKQTVIDTFSSGDSLMNRLVDMLGGSSDYSEYKYNDIYTHGDVDLSDSFYIVKMTYFDENENPYHVQGYLDMQGWDLHNQFAREMYENPSIKSKVDLYQVFHDETKASGFKIVGSICSSYNFAPTSRKK